MDIARQGQQFLLGQHGDGFLSHRLGCLFQIQIFRHRNVEHIVSAAGALCHQGLEHLLRVLIQIRRHGDTIHRAVRRVLMGRVGDLLLFQRPHDVGFFFLVLGHGLTSYKYIRSNARISMWAG